MSETSDQDTSEPDIAITDDKLPEDLVPGEDNPLAEGLDAGERVDGLLEGGQAVERSEPDGPGGENDTSGDDQDDATGS